MSEEPRDDAADAGDARTAGDDSRGASGAKEPAWKRKARLAAIFGDVVPESTSDDRDEQGSAGTSEEWLKRQVPPHHG